MAVVLAAGCFDDSGEPAAPVSSDASRNADLASQAHLWLGVEGAENWYVGESEDPWITDSWITEAGSFDVVMTNRAGFDVSEVYLLVTVDEPFLSVPGWWIEVDGVMLDISDFYGESTAAFGFDGGSHGVYPPSGDGVFHPHPMEGVLPADGTWRIPIRASSGGLEGFRIHFDAGSTRLWSPPSHDVTAFPPDGEDPPGVCCLEDGSCQIVTESECEMLEGVYFGPGDDCGVVNCTGE